MFKRKPDPSAFVGSNIELGRKGISFDKAAVLEIVLFRRIVYIMGKTFSSSFVQDCGKKAYLKACLNFNGRIQYTIS